MTAPTPSLSPTPSLVATPALSPVHVTSATTLTAPDGFVIEIKPPESSGWFTAAAAAAVAAALLTAGAAVLVGIWNRKTGKEASKNAADANINAQSAVTAADRAATAAERGAEASTRSAAAAQVGAEAATKSALAAAHSADVQERNLANQRELQHQLTTFQREQAERARSNTKSDQRSEALTAVLQVLLRRPIFPTLYMPISGLDRFGAELDEWLSDINTVMPNAWKNSNSLELDVLINRRHELRHQWDEVSDHFHILRQKMNSASIQQLESIDQLNGQVETRKALAKLYTSFQRFDDDVTRTIRWIRTRLLGEST